METKVRVLHIDDNIHDRKLVKDALQKEHDGFEVTEADSREKFEKYLAEQHFDIVLSDFNILGFDGLQVLEVVKELKPNLPVIIVTGTGSEEIAIQAMRMGAADYVIKSVKHIQGLAPTIKTVLENRRINEERINALADLRESEELHRSIYDNSSVAILLTSPDGSIFAANNFACQLFGMTEAEVCKAGRDGLVDPLSPNLAMLLEERDKTGRAKGELTFVKKDGTNFQAEVSSVVFRDKDCKQKTSMVIRDLTEQKQAEEKLVIAKEKAEESDRLKTAFLQNISHEIRTPMNAIVGFSAIINEPDLQPEKRQRFTDIIIQSTNQLLSIITDIVNIATIDAGQEKVREKEVNLNSLCRLLYEQFNSVLQKQSISFAYKTGLPDMEALIITDRNKLSETLTNLISNAQNLPGRGQSFLGTN
jgi:PAS domain S-box-containing protein